MEVSPDGRAGPPPERLQVGPAVENALKSGGERLGAAFGLQAVYAVDEPLADAAALRHDHHAAIGRRFQRRAAERLALPCRKREYVELVVGIAPDQLLLRAGASKKNAVSNPVLGGQGEYRRIGDLAVEVDRKVVVASVLQQPGRFDQQVDTLMPAHLARRNDAQRPALGIIMAPRRRLFAQDPIR